MKSDIHPEYVEATVTCGCGNVLNTGPRAGAGRSSSWSSGMMACCCWNVGLPGCGNVGACTLAVAADAGAATVGMTTMRSKRDKFATTDSRGCAT